MIEKEIIINQDACDMTVFPSRIMKCSRHSKSTFTTLGDFAALSSRNGDLAKQTTPLSLPIQIDAINRSIQLISAPLSHKYENQIMSFKSDHTPLLQFLKMDAFVYEKSGNTCTTLFFDGDDNKLVAFCSTKCSSLKMKGSKIRSLYPTVEIAALCVDDRYRYTGIGQAIINHTIQQIYIIKSLVGVQLVTLFAIPNAVAFYQKLNFQKLTKGMKVFQSPAHKWCIPMYLPLSSTSIENDECV